MPNELILILELIFIFGMTLAWYAFFGKSGLYTFIVIMIVLANIQVVILIKAFGLEQTLGNVFFASTFLITDILSELYGKKYAQKAVNMQIMASILFVISSQMWLLYTPSSGDYAFEGVKTIFSNTARIIFASLIVNVIAQKLDVWLYHKIWNFTTKKSGKSKSFLWLRNNGSTLTSQLVNSILFSILAFAGTYDWATVATIIASTYLIFIFTSLADTPIVYLARKVYNWRIQKGYEKPINDTDISTQNEQAI